MQTEFFAVTNHLARVQKFILGALAIAILGLGILGLGGALRRLPTTIPNDFHMYYVEGWVVNHAMPLFVEDYMASAAGMIGVASIGYGYPPFFAALMRPVAFLPLGIASGLWLLGNVGCVLVTMWMLTRLFHASRMTFLLLSGAALLMPSVYDTFLLGQINLWLTLVFAGALVLGAREKDTRLHVAAGMLMGIAIAVKVYPIVLVLIFVLYRRYTALLAMGVTILATFGIGILYGGGWDATFRYWTVIVPTQSILFTFPAEQSSAAVMSRLFQTTYMTVPLSPEQTVYLAVSPWWNDPNLGHWVWYAWEALILGATALGLWQIQRMFPKRDGVRKSEGFIWSFALLLAAMLLFLPHVWDHYLAHLLIPFAVLILSARRWLEDARLLFLILAAFLLLILHRYWAWFLRFIESPWLMLFGFAGAFLLWLAVLLFVLRYLPPSATKSFTPSKR